MLDQSFTTDNFRKIFDYENRKGCYLEGKYFPEIETITKQLKTCVGNIKKLDKKLKDYEEDKSNLYVEKDTLKLQKEELLGVELEKISKRISQSDFRIKLLKVNTPTGKPAYSIDKSDVYSFFVIKQIQYNIKKLYKVKQANRHDIICQLRGLLNNDFQKYIVRTDISEFYESIQQDKLLEKINKDAFLSLSSRKFIKDILRQYSEISGSQNGIPRGIGISAYLAEIYMCDFDEAIKTHPELIFYARYVDDIIVVYAPNLHTQTTQFICQIEENSNKLSLNLNKDKTEEIDLITNQNGKFDYLGYCFEIKGKKVSLKISKNKIQRYKERIEKSFNNYLKQKNHEKQARNILIKRLRFLTGNTRLSNNKDNALVGSYFSNSLISDASSLNPLDVYLDRQIAKISSDKLKRRLKQMTFQLGWNEKRFYKFSPLELQEIVKAWKNGN